MSLFTPIAAAAATTFFGDRLQDLAATIACTIGNALGTASSHKACSEVGKADAVGIATAVSTMAAIIGLGASLRRGLIKPEEALSSTFAALFGALLSLISAASNDHVLSWERLKTPLYIYLVASFLFAAPLIVLARENPVQAMKLQGRIASAALIGVAFGLVIQCVFGLVWVGQNHPLDSSKFVIAPMATVAIVGAWGVAALDPIIQNQTWTGSQWPRRRWICICALAAIVAASGFGAEMTPGAFERAGAEAGAFWVSALMLPGLIALLVLNVRPSSGFLVRREIRSAILAAALAGVSAVGIELIFGPGDADLRSHFLLFVLTHAVAATAVVTVVGLASRLMPP